MKKLLFIFLSVVIILPLKTYAIELRDYNYTNLEETLKQEKIEPEFTDYKENSKQIPIYLFRGDGCTYCKGFLSYLNSITDEYGKYFKLVSFEVWKDKNNSDLMDKVSTFLNEPAGGVPYIIIGDEVFGGYSENYNESILSQITNLYKSKDKYDVFEAMEKAEREEKWKEKVEAIEGIIWDLVFAVLSTTTILIFINFKNKKLNERLDKIEEKLSKK